MKKIIGFIIGIIVICSILSIFIIDTEKDNNAEKLKDMESEQNSVNEDIALDYFSAEKFEKALNNGENVNGKVVKFIVNEYKPDSVMGYNAWAGEHLNFISDNDIALNSSDEVTCRVISAKKNWDSWFIKYEVIEIIKNDINNNSTETKEESEEQYQREVEEQAKKEAEEQAKKEAEEQAKKEAEEQAKKEAEEQAKKEAEEQARKEAEEQAKKQAEEDAKKQTTTSMQPSMSSSNSKSNSNNSNGKTVYRTPSGKRYHFDPDCGGKNSYTITLDAAKSSGLTPCQKCAK